MGFKSIIKTEFTESEYSDMGIEDLIKLKKKKYSDPDIESKMSEDEKILNKIIAKKFSDINEAIRNKRNKK